MALLQIFSASLKLAGLGFYCNLPSKLVLILLKYPKYRHTFEYIRSNQCLVCGFCLLCIASACSALSLTSGLLQCLVVVNIAGFFHRRCQLSQLVICLLSFVGATHLVNSQQTAIQPGLLNMSTNWPPLHKCSVQSASLVTKLVCAQPL